MACGIVFRIPAERREKEAVMKTRIALVLVLFGSLVGFSPRSTSAAILNGTWGCPAYGGVLTTPFREFGCKPAPGTTGTIPPLWELAENGVLYPKSNIFSDIEPRRGGELQINQLAARGVIRGQDGTFDVYGRLNRAQMAVMIVRLMGWENQPGTSAFSDRGSIDPELWQAVGILAAKGIARGYGDGTFHPTDLVSFVQVISMITRAMVVGGYWQQQPDNPALFMDIPASSGHRSDIVTYTHYVEKEPEVAIDWTAVSSRWWTVWGSPAERLYAVQGIWGAIAPLIMKQNPAQHCRVDGRIIVCTD